MTDLLRTRVLDALLTVARRPLRVRLDGLPRSLCAVVVVLWLAWIAAAVVLLVPGAVEPFAPETLGGAAVPTDDDSFLVVWTVLLATSALSSGAATVLLQLRAGADAGRDHERVRRTVVAALVALGTALVPAFFLVGAGSLLAVGVTLWLGFAATGLALAGGLSGRIPLIVSAGAAAACAWLPLGLDALVSVVPLSMVSSYAILGSAAVAVTGFVTIAGVASAAESANATAGSVERRRVRTLPTALVLAGVLVVLVLRYTVLNEVFGEAESELWSLRTWWSWPHAAVIAALVVVAALRSASAPFSSLGQRTVTVLVSISAGLSNLVLVVLSVVLFAVLFVTGTVSDPSGYLGLVHLVSLAVLLMVLVIVFRRRYRRSTGRVGAVVALVYLVPFVGSLVLGLRDRGVPVFWASPTQVVVLLVLTATALFAVSLGRRRPVDHGMILRLAVIPVAAVHAGELIPAVWDDALSRPVVIVLSLAAFLLLSPPRHPDARVTARRLVASSALQVAILGTFATSVVLDYDAQLFTVVAVIWLAVPVSAMLVCRATAPRPVEAEPEAPQETSSASAFSMRL
ncbi:hypothetical protein N1031_00790 [Herbiconiux moechotypicola]|uniref:Uncharacterized protein n=1 Tax=Herbiconiux moechotypicola TaxID=637393 RepID=A0ABN3D893_9MICO|nr:hypothetical protein [Herbiconiux moechotypicola]MCS5728288.1 hypothetical protein [Herbiconiux moechotypicola]